MLDIYRRIRFSEPDSSGIRYQIGLEIEKGESKKIIEGGSFSDAVTVDNVGYRIGVGGLHSTDEPGWFEADEQWRIVDLDVKSFYPALILNHGLCPAHLPKRQFLLAFDKLRLARLAAADAGQDALATGLKVAINAIFGKTKLAYSWLLDPCMNVSITVLGQLTLLTFIDLIAGLDGVQVISANTDGLMLRLRRDIADEVIEALNMQAGQLQFDLKWQDYRLVCRRDINNYVAVPVAGEIKAKGAYGRDKYNLGKKATNRIVSESVQQHFANNVPVADTVSACREITEFVDYFKATKGYTIVDDVGGTYGTIARWYRSTEGVHLAKRKTLDGKLTQLVERGAKVINDLPPTFPADVDTMAYVAMADALVLAITHPELRVASTIPHAELSVDQRARLHAAQTATAADPERCAALDLDPLHDAYAANGKGNRHDTLKAVLVRLWLSQAGAISVADLYWAATELDAAVGQFKARKLRTLCEWIGREISPFPVPRTPKEVVARAMVWAAEHVEVLKQPKKPDSLKHRHVLDSAFISGPVLRKYATKRDEYHLACAVAAVFVKHAIPPDQNHICQIMAEIHTYFEQQVSGTHANL